MWKNGLFVAIFGWYSIIMATTVKGDVEYMREVSLNVFLKTMRESCQNERRYCFILGAGASRESGIKTGQEMAAIWRRELDDYLPDDLAAIMGELEKDKDDITPSSKNYFSLYALRFYPDYKNGSAYLEKAMERAQPSFGYYPLATHLAGTENNLVITTNFDSLVEDALFIYTDKKPLVISHELLAEYINMNTKRPIVAKIHRGLFFDPLNRAEEVDGLSEKWKDVLQTAFQIFTPVVIGYAGGDHSLMDFLNDDSVKMNGLYWCYRHDAPTPEIQALVEKKNGCFIPIEGFDEMMYMLGREFGYGNPRDRIMEIAKKRAEDYEKQMEQFNKKLGSIVNPNQAQSKLLSSLSEELKKEKESLDKRIQANKNDVDALKERAKIYRRAEDYESALADLDAAITVDPQNTGLLNEKGITYTSTDDYTEAIKCHTDAIKLNPNNSVFYYNRGFNYYYVKEYVKAIGDFTDAISLDSDDSDYYRYRAKAFLGLKGYTDAIDNFSTAIDLDADSIDAYQGRAQAYTALGMTKEAEEDLETVKRLQGEAEPQPVSV